MEITIRITPEEAAAFAQVKQERPECEMTFSIDNQVFKQAVHDALTESES